MSRVIRDVLLLAPNDYIRPVSVEVSDEGYIGEIFEDPRLPDDAEVIFDGGGEVYLTAGFIDIHTHGANGFDLSNATLEAIEAHAKAKLAEGVTTFLPTTWTASREEKIAMATAVAAYRENQRFARAPFLHVEGPYLNPAQAGAQDPEKMRLPDIDEIRYLHSICPIGLISLAIELEGALPFLTEVKELGIVTSAAHSAATYPDFVAARQAGLTHLTHYCNQMSALHHRNIGLVGAGLLDDDVMIEVICDGIHLSPDMVRLIFKLRSCDRLMLITDSIAASHLGDGTYSVSGNEVTVKDGVARIAAGNLAGSVVTFDQAFRNTASLTGLPLNELSKTCAMNQARSLRLSDRGRIQEGLLADLTLLTPNLEVVATYVGGEKLYSA